MESVSDVPDPQADVESVSDVPDPQADVMASVSDVHDPQVDVMESVSDVPDPQADLMESVSDVPDPLADVGSVSDVPDPQADVMESVSDVPDPQADVMGSVSDVPDPQADLMDRVSDFPDPQADVMESVSDVPDPLAAGQEVYLLHNGRKLFKGRYTPFPVGQKRVVHCRPLGNLEERFLITHVYKRHLNDFTEFDEDVHGVDSFIKWDRNSISLNELEAAVRSRSCDDKTEVDLFWNDVHVARGTLELDTNSSPCDINSKCVRVLHVYKENREKLLKDGGDILLLNNIKEYSLTYWPTKEIEHCKAGVQSKKRKRNIQKTNASKKREQKRIKMTELHEPIEACTCKANCGSKIDQQTQNKIREQYWNINQVGPERNAFLSNFISRIPKKSHKINSSEIRKFTIIYFLPSRVPSTSDVERVQVCKKMFHNVFGISEKKSRVLTKKKYEQLGMAHGLTGKMSNNPRLPSETTKKVIQHINKLPTVPSHYRRKHTQKRYFEADVTPVIMFKLFKEENPTVKISQASYLKIIKTLNIGFYKPKNDLCSQCTAYKNSKKTAHDISAYNEHMDRKKRSRIAKEKDKKRAETEDTFAAFIIDMEAVKNCPKAQSGEFFYISKLSCYDLSVYDLKTGNMTCFLWDQTQAARGSNEVGSCILHLLRSVPKKITEVVIWADTCSGQNRNKENAAGVLHFLCCEKDHVIQKSTSSSLSRVITSPRWTLFIK